MKIRATLAIWIIVLLTSCSSFKVKLKADNKWYNVIALQADDFHVYKVKKLEKNNKEDSSTNDKTEIRLVLIEPFMNFENLPETTSNPHTTTTRTQDTGPLDISQNGSIRIVSMNGGIQLISRTNEKNAILKIKKLKQKRQDYGK